MQFGIGKAVRLGLAAMVAALVGLPALAQSADEMTKIGNDQRKAKQYVAARATYRAACDMGSASACTSYGFLHEHGFGGEKNRAVALDYYKRGCDGGNGNGCTNLGILSDVPTEKARYYKLGCDGASSNGCELLGTMNFTGTDLPKDLAAAYSLYQRACRMGRAKSCHYAAWRKVKGEGTPADAIAALPMFKTNCDSRNYAASCLSYAHHYGRTFALTDGPKSASVLKRDLAIIGYQEKACRLGAKVDGCRAAYNTRRSIMLSNGYTGSAKSVSAVRQRYSNALKAFRNYRCDGGECEPHYQREEKRFVAAIELSKLVDSSDPCNINSISSSKPSSQSAYNARADRLNNARSCLRQYGAVTQKVKNVLDRFGQPYRNNDNGGIRYSLNTTVGPMLKAVFDQHQAIFDRSNSRHQSLVDTHNRHGREGI